jgi:hypothetical protein
MGVTEQQRHALLTWFEEQMGPERAATMMDLMPPSGADELATKRDLADLEARLDARFAGIDARFTDIDARFEGIDARFEGIAARFDVQDARFDAKLEAMRSTTLRTVGTWLFASQAAVITAIGVATGLIIALT